MARPIVWPQVPLPADPAAAPEASAPVDPAAALDAPAIAAAFGPELARLMGLRISARPDRETPLPESALALARIRLAAKSPVAVDIACADTAAALLLERLFGARAADAAAAGAADLALLPPGSASWTALCRTVATAATRALATAGLPAGGAPVLPARALRAPLPPGFAILLDVDGAPCRLLLSPELPPLPVPAPRPAPDLALWRRQARARAFELDLPVSLRIAETRMPVAQVASLMEGDILPLDRPESLDLMAGGRRIARLPASSFAPRDPNPTSTDGDNSQ
jgi:hypothetical protein